MRVKHVATPLIAMMVAMPMAGAAASNETSEKPDFSKADTNGNGKIAISEATASGVPKAEAKREDIDSDGKLTRADWQFVDMNPNGQGGSDPS